MITGETGNKLVKQGLKKIRWVDPRLERPRDVGKRFSTIARDHRRNRLPGAVDTIVETTAKDVVNVSVTREIVVKVAVEYLVSVICCVTDDAGWVLTIVDGGNVLVMVDAG